MNLSKSVSALWFKNVGPFAYCAQSVRQHDLEGFLCISSMPSDVMRAVFVVHAFNIELSRTLSLSPFVANGRLRFWNEALHNALKGNPPSHPVAQSLADVAKRYDLNRYWLKDLIDARLEWHEENVYGTIQSMEEYYGRTFSTVLYLTLQIFGVSSVHADHAANHLGKAIGFINTLRSVGRHPSTDGSGFIPKQLLIMYDIREQQFDAKNGHLLSPVIEDLALQAAAHLSRARLLKNDIPKRAQRAFVFSAPVEHYLAVIRRCGFDPFDANVQSRSVFLLWHIFKRIWGATY